jgi:hypothetical protein
MGDIDTVFHVKYPILVVGIVDDLEGSALWHPSNLIRIDPWYGQDLNDVVLMEQLWPFLEAMAGKRDLPRELRDAFQQKKFTSLHPACVQVPRPHVEK